MYSIIPRTYAYTVDNWKLASEIRTKYDETEKKFAT